MALSKFVLAPAQLCDMFSAGQVSDGPVGSMISGYSIIKANSLDEAVGLAKGCPVLGGGAQISVFETFNAMG